MTQTEVQNQVDRLEVIEELLKLPHSYTFDGIEFTFWMDVIEDVSDNFLMWGYTIADAGVCWVNPINGINQMHLWYTESVETTKGLMDSIIDFYGFLEELNEYYENKNRV